MEADIQAFIRFWRDNEDHEETMFVENGVLTALRCSDGCCRDSVDIDALCEALEELLGPGEIPEPGIRVIKWIGGSPAEPKGWQMKLPGVTWEFDPAVENITALNGLDDMIGSHLLNHGTVCTLITPEGREYMITNLREWREEQLPFLKKELCDAEA